MFSAINHAHRFIVIIILLVSIVCSTRAQETINIDELEKRLSGLYGLEKLKTLNILSGHYQSNNTKKATRYARQASTLASNMLNESNIALLGEEAIIHPLNAYFLYGSLLYDEEKLSNALDEFAKCNELAERSSRVEFAEKSLIMINKIDSIGIRDGFLKKTLKPLGLGDKVSNTSINLRISSLLKIAKHYEKKENYDKAIQHYSRAINLMRNLGDAEQVAEIQVNIADMNKKSGNLKEAVAYYQITQETFAKLGDSTAAVESKKGLQSVFDELEDLTPKSNLKSASNIPLSPISTSTDSSIQTLKQLKNLAEQYEKRQDFTQSLKYYKLYNELNSQLREDQQRFALDSIALLSQAQKIRLLVQENELGELQLSQTNTELERQAAFRKWLIIGLVVSAVLFILFCWLFITKKRAHKQLTTTYSNLEETKSKLIDAEKKIKKLLGQQESDEIAQALLVEGDNRISSKFVCIMFLDIRDFTPFAESRTPEEIIAYQNDVFGFMIEIIAKYHGVINQFMGDGFMATFGAPTSYQNDVQNAYDAAREIIFEVNSRSESGEIYPTKVGIGLHAGNVVTGNVGTEIRKQYSITGNTVITAARIEQLNKTYLSQLLISDTVYEHLNNNGELPDEGVNTTIKGRKEPIKIYKVA